MNEGIGNNWMIVVFTVYILFLVGMFWFFKTVWKRANKDEIKQEKGLFMIMVFIATLYPLLGLAGAPILGGNGFAHLYHHRFFLVITWMFAGLFMVELFKWCEQKKNFVVGYGLAIVIVLFAFIYSVSAHHELGNLIDKTPCKSDVALYIAHESPFSALPYDVKEREYGCNWYNFVSTNQTKMMLNGGGGDAMEPGSIYYNRELPMYVDYYYVYAEGTVPIDGNHTVVAREDGVELWYITRVAHPDNATIVGNYYDNSTGAQFNKYIWSDGVERSW
jgi:hypothetical protein